MAQEMPAPADFADVPVRALLASSGLCAAFALIVRGAVPWLRARRARRERALSAAADQVERANQARIQARESEERVRLLLDSTAEAICGLDLSGIVTFCNPTALRILGPHAKVSVFAVSVDPKGDTPAAVKAYEREKRLVPQFHYLIGSRPELMRVWRAWNEVSLDRLEDAWRDIEQARRLWVNAEVEKLGGIVAYKRKQLEVARSRFEAARSLRGNDCETLFDLGTVHAELSAWRSSVSVLADAATCLERSRSALAAEIAGIRASQTPAERKARQIARREQEIVTADRMLVQSWFNTAVAYFNLSNQADARSFAERVVSDEQLGERARALLSRIDAHP